MSIVFIRAWTIWRKLRSLLSKQWDFLTANTIRGPKSLYFWLETSILARNFKFWLETSIVLVIGLLGFMISSLGVATNISHIFVIAHYFMMFLWIHKFLLRFCEFTSFYDAFVNSHEFLNWYHFTNSHNLVNICDYTYPRESFLKFRLW